MAKGVVDDFRAIADSATGAEWTGFYGGSMSVRNEEKILITRRGILLGKFEDEDLVEVGMEGETGAAEASLELAVHRAIYKATKAKAVVHL